MFLPELGTTRLCIQPFVMEDVAAAHALFTDGNPFLDVERLQAVDIREPA